MPDTLRKDGVPEQGGNLLWVVYGLVEWNWHVVVMFGFYWLMAVWGLKNNGD